MTRVVAIDATVHYASIAAITDDGQPRCAYRTTPTMEGEGSRNRSIADDHMLHIEFAADIVDAVTESEPPALVVLRRPSLGVGAGGRRTGRATVKGGRIRRHESATGELTKGEGEKIVTLDHSAIRRLAVHWELVRQLTDCGVPIAEIGVFSAEEALNGGYVTEKRVGARQGVKGYGALAKLTQALYPHNSLTVPNDGGRADPRYRVSTVALAALGALVVEGVPSPIEPTEAIWETLRRGATFPSEFPLPRLGDLETGTTHGQRVAAFYEAKAHAYDEMELAELEELGPRTNRNLAAAWELALAAKRAAEEDGMDVDPMVTSERDAEL
ncbi:hypothetical protein NJBCHELONAE_01910 [Mycobacteroides chelonae]|uniref:hypothetical protein n=1 Tax=Mycobacteroides chelonae TaxID=1774 RepID=UPI0021DDF21F|nr:hypothetical protein [Mycobacteroides chelonae]GLE54880.1 hypothetical protein NJBCHELONAE_01910 [Mycobacteroides chelonae]